MPFPYYERLSAKNRAIYRKSAGIAAVAIDHPRAVWPLVTELREALQRDDRIAVEQAANELATALVQDVGTASVQVQVLAVRPHKPTEELHGLYTWEPGNVPQIQVWMRTAKQRRVVAFKTFLRTLLHEMCHHFDFHLFELGESFHTEGFFRRESSLVKQLLPEG